MVLPELPITWSRHQPIIRSRNRTASVVQCNAADLEHQSTLETTALTKSSKLCSSSLPVQWTRFCKIWKTARTWTLTRGPTLSMRSHYSFREKWCERAYCDVGTISVEGTKLLISTRNQRSMREIQVRESVSIPCEWRVLPREPAGDRTAM